MKTKARTKRVKSARTVNLKDYRTPSGAPMDQYQDCPHCGASCPFEYRRSVNVDDDGRRRANGGGFYLCPPCGFIMNLDCTKGQLPE